MTQKSLKNQSKETEKLVIDVDKQLLTFIRLLKSHQGKKDVSDSEFINELLAYSMGQIMGVKKRVDGTEQLEE